MITTRAPDGANNVSFAESLIPFLVCERQGCWHITWKIFVKLYIWCLHPIPMEKLANFSPLKALAPPPQRAPLQKEADFIKVCRLKWQPWEGTQLYLYIHVAPSFIYSKELDIDCGVLEMSCWALWGILRHFEVFWGIMSDAIEVCENVLATHVRDEHLAQIWDRLTAEKIWGGEHAVFLKCSTNISTSSTIKFQNSSTFENHCFLFWLTR